MTKLEYEQWLLNDCYKELNEEIEPFQVPIRMNPTIITYYFTEVNYSNQDHIGICLRGLLNYLIEGQAILKNNSWENTRKKSIILGKEFLEFISLFTKRILTAYELGEEKYFWLKEETFFVKKEQLFNPGEKFLHYPHIEINIYDVLGSIYDNNGCNVGLLYLMPIYVRNLACSSDVDVRPFVKDILDFYQKDFNNDNINYILRAFAPYFIFYLGSFCREEEKAMVENYLSILDEKYSIKSQIETNYLYAKYIDGADIEMHKKMIMSGNIWNTKMIEDLNEIVFRKRKK